VSLLVTAASLRDGDGRCVHVSKGRESVELGMAVTVWAGLRRARCAKAKATMTMTMEDGSLV
jgi:hypothetical protein